MISGENIKSPLPSGTMMKMFEKTTKFNKITKFNKVTKFNKADHQVQQGHQVLCLSGMYPWFIIYIGFETVVLNKTLFTFQS